jgi:sigma-B regulation protein RsbU (phosphoserine phosphatase)
MLKATTVPLGLFVESEFPVLESQLQAGDKLVVYSDGVSEATDWSGEQFGEKRIEAVLKANATLEAGELYEKLRQELATFTCDAEQDDDVTLLVLGYQG